MKKIVPFKKEIPLDTNIAEINSISLENTLEKKDDNVITGEFIISGTYKMTQTSINVDNFEYKLPVNITIDKKYSTDNVVVDINDFYYEVINDQILAINIEVAVDNLEERKETIEMERVEEVSEVVNESVEAEKINEMEEIEEVKEEAKEKEERTVDEVKSIFSNMDDVDNYVTYKIHIVTENDTLESISEEYQTNREALAIYNDLDNIKLGDKLIIADGN